MYRTAAKHMTKSGNYCNYQMAKKLSTSGGRISIQVRCVSGKLFRWLPFPLSPIYPRISTLWNLITSGVNYKCSDWRRLPNDTPNSLYLPKMVALFALFVLVAISLTEGTLLSALSTTYLNLFLSPFVSCLNLHLCFAFDCSNCRELLSSIV